MQLIAISNVYMIYFDRHSKATAIAIQLLRISSTRQYAHDSSESILSTGTRLMSQKSMIFACELGFTSVGVRIDVYILNLGVYKEYIQEKDIERGS